MTHLRPTLLLGIVLAWAGPLLRADSVAGEGAPARPVLTVVRAAAVPGMRAEAGDPAWSGPAAGVELPLLTKTSGANGRAEAFSTRVELRWDADFLYARFWCRASETPWAPQGGKRDAPHHTGDVVEVFLDPVGDARQFVEVQVSPANGVFDKLYLLTGEPRSGANGVLLDEVLKRAQWEFPEWTWDGLRSATAVWKQDGHMRGWIADLALPAKPLLRRLGQGSYQQGMTLRAHLLRNACPADSMARTGRAFLSMSWTPVPEGRPHRAPMLMGELRLRE